MNWDDERDTGPTGYPSLSQMTVKALSDLMANQNNGFVLMVECGKIDKAHHKNLANRAMSETVAMDQAVRDAISILKEKDIFDDTLIIVTADHSHTMAIMGYARRGTDIRGK